MIRIMELKVPRNFDPVSSTVVPPRRFEDLRVGDVFRAPSRTLTDAHAAAFQTVSADNHAIHYDVEYARRHGHIGPVVHGLQVFAFTALGATLLPQYIGDVFVAFASASCKFLKEVHAGDALYPALEIIALAPQGDSGRVTTRATVHNRRGELVLDGAPVLAENLTHGRKVASTSDRSVSIGAIFTPNRGAIETPLVGGVDRAVVVTACASHLDL
jgi:acyl dehydratase